jgi:hypothetical protein
MFPALLVSLLLNLVTAGFILSTYFHTNSREDSHMFSQVYQDYQDPSTEPKYGDKMDRLEDRGEDEDSLEDRTDEKRFDNMYSQDVYNNNTRSIYY